MGMNGDRVFNLLHEAWLPVRRRSGAVTHISPAGITDGLADDPIVAFAWPRPDFNGAALEFVIGLLSSTAAAPRDEDDWATWWREPPSPAVLQERFGHVASAFALDGPGPRFMQDLDPLEGAKSNPIGSILIDAPGEQTIKHNTDLFVTRGGTPVLGRAAAAMAVFTLNAYAPGGGQGYRTSLRGGGPLTTLIVHDDPVRGDTLWSRIWCSVESSEMMSRRASGQVEGRPVFPWLKPTRTSEKRGGARTTPDDVHPLQVYWGMPRRTRLVFERAEGRCCAVTGARDDVVVTAYRAKNYGTDYSEGFEHPLTPYYRATRGSATKLPRHPNPSLVGYRVWEGVVVQSSDRLRDPAQVLGHWRNERRIMVGATAGIPRLLVFGYDIYNSNKVRGWMESEMPLWRLDDRETLKECEQFIQCGIAAATSVGGALTRAVKLSRYARIKDAKGDYGFIPERLFRDTENAFQEALADALRMIDAHPDADDPTLSCRQRWMEGLKRAGLALFDEYAPSDGLEGRNMLRHVQARFGLATVLCGRGKDGKSLFEGDLGIAAPTKATGQAPIKETA